MKRAEIAGDEGRRSEAPESRPVGHVASARVME